MMDPELARAMRAFLAEVDAGVEAAEVADASCLVIHRYDPETDHHSFIGPFPVEAVAQVVAYMDRIGEAFERDNDGPPLQQWVRAVLPPDKGWEGR